jgi:Helix-turn-helix domain
MTNQQNSTPWLLTIPEVAMIVRKSPAAVHQATKRGDLQCHKAHRRILITRQQVADWLNLPVEDVRISYSRPDGEAVS